MAQVILIIITRIMLLINKLCPIMDKNFQTTIVKDNYLNKNKMHGSFKETNFDVKRLSSSLLPHRCSYSRLSRKVLNERKREENYIWRKQSNMKKKLKWNKGRRKEKK